MSSLIIYKASAGSGKTFRLTEEFLKLAFRRPFHSILAVTFTNKAAAEMKGRIVGELSVISSGGDSHHLKALIEETGLDEAALRLRAGEILDDILHNFSRFSVGTIDSFFQLILRSFAREVSLDSGFELELDNQLVLERVIDRVFVESTSNRELRNWLISYAGSRIRDGASWNFRDDMRGLAQHIFSEKYQQFSGELADKLSDKSFMNSYMESLNKVRHGFESEMKRIGNAALEIIEKKGLSVEDFSYGHSGVAGYFVKLSRKKSFEPGVRVLSAIDEPEGWYTKKSQRKGEIEDAFHSGLNRCLNEAVDYYNSRHPHYVTAELILSNIFTLGILTDITSHTRDYTYEKNLFLLADVPALLKGIIGENQSPFIYEKTGHFLKHFMIDEFQDTSRVQWENFSPLILNSLSENNRNVLVGDVKQSIYRWRNGDWRILAGEVTEQFATFTPTVRPLETNRRSLPQIVEFNNLLFKKAPAILQEQFAEDCAKGNISEEYAREMESLIGLAYGESEQKFLEKYPAEKGFVKISFASNDDETSWRERVNEKLPELIEELLGRGYKPGDIALLVRNKKDGREVASVLMDWQADEGTGGKRKPGFISDEFLLLNGSVSVRFLLSVMAYLDNPGDRISKAVMLNEYSRYIRRVEKRESGLHDMYASASSGNTGEWESYLPPGFVSEINLLRQISLFDMVERLITMFGLDRFESEIPYLTAFQDSILEYSAKEPAGLGSFLEWWDENSGNRSVTGSDNQDAIRIMTVHKAKGLQFKVVLLPYCDWDIDHRPVHKNFLWCKPEAPPFNKLKLLPVKYGSKMANSLFADDYFSERMQVFVDNLNLLYVAFTRPESELHVFAPEPPDMKGKKKGMKSVSQLLHNFLQSPLPAGKSAVEILPAKDADGEWEVFSTGLPAIHEKKEEDKDKGEVLMDSYPAYPGSQKLKLRLRGEGLLAADKARKEKINRGVIMHRVFQDIETAGDIKKALRRIHLEGKLTGQESDQLAGEIKRLISGKDVSRWFDGSWQVKTEPLILLNDGEMKRPDRVLVGEGKTVVIDYKFGDRRHSSHISQVRQYMRYIREMGHENVEGFIWYVDMGETVNVESEGKG